VLEACSTVVTLADVTEVIDKRLERRIVFVVDVADFLFTEVTLLFARVATSLVGLFWHNAKG